MWEDRQRTVLVTEASPGRWIRPVHEEDDLVSCANPCVECELLEDRCVGWVDVRDLQLSAPEPEEHALRASRRYRGHRGLLHVPSVVAFVESHVARTREDRARYKRGGTVGPALFDAAGFVQAAFANASARPVFIPRHAHEQHHFAEPVDDLNEVEPGDLIFFGVHPPDARARGCVDVRHVGVITAVRASGCRRDGIDRGIMRRARLRVRHRPDRRSRDRRPRQRHRAEVIRGNPGWGATPGGSTPARGQGRNTRATPRRSDWRKRY